MAQSEREYERDRTMRGGTMPYARNALDGSQVYFEDDGGDGAVVILHGRLLD